MFGLETYAWHGTLIWLQLRGGCLRLSSCQIWWSANAHRASYSTDGIIPFHLENAH